MKLNLNWTQEVFKLYFAICEFFIPIEHKLVEEIDKLYWRVPVHSTFLIIFR